MPLLVSTKYNGQRDVLATLMRGDKPHFLPNYGSGIRRVYEFECKGDSSVIWLRSSSPSGTPKTITTLRAGESFEMIFTTAGGLSQLVVFEHVESV